MLNFQQWSVKRKLVTGFTAIAIFLVLVGGVSYYYVSKTVSTYRSVVNENVPNLVIFLRMQDALKSIEIPVESLVGSNSTVEQANKGKSAVDEELKKFNEAAKDYEAAPFAEGEAAVWKDFQEKHWQPFVEQSNELVRLSGTKNPADQKKRDEIGEKEYDPRVQAMEDAFDKLMQFQLTGTKQKSALAEDYFKQLNIAMVSIILIGFVLAQLLGWAIARQLSTGLSNLSDDLAHGAEEVNASVSELTSASQELSSAATQQAASLEQTSSAIEEISAMVSKASESARQSSEVSEQSRDQAQRGQKVVEEMVQSMGQINVSNQNVMSEVTSMNDKISDIVKVIQEIGNKTKVINDIVFQTKLLSFNASVEAARAGEHGKGFAVVAEEVGNLAQMSGNAAKEISTMLDESVQRVEVMVSESKAKIEALMKSAKETVDHGGEVAEECGHVLEEIVKNAVQVSQMVHSISTASEEQTHGVSEITKAIQQLNQATHMNATAATQSAGASEQLSVQAQSLKQSADRLRAMVEGGTAA